MTRIGVLGAHGRMGKSICEAVQERPGLELAAALGSSDSLEQLVDAGVEVVVDVTTTAAAQENLPWLAEHAMSAVVGTTGFSDADRKHFAAAFSAAGKRCFLVPNFAIGAVLLMRFAELAAPHFDGVEIIELHHDKKKDAPSGTARLTADKIAAARTKPWAPDPTEVETVERVRGGDVDGVRLHSVRLRGMLAHEEVIFGGTGQTLTIRHDSYDRSSFMAGVVLALESLDQLDAGLSVGLEAVLPL